MLNNFNFAIIFIKNYIIRTLVFKNKVLFNARAVNRLKSKPKPTSVKITHKHTTKKPTIFMHFSLLFSSPFPQIYHELYIIQKSLKKNFFVIEIFYSTCIPYKFEKKNPDVSPLLNK